MEIAFDSEWGEEVRAARERAGLGQAELGELIGVPQATISQIETWKINASSAVIPLVRRLGRNGLRMPRILFTTDEERRWTTAGVQLLETNPAAFRAVLATAELYLAPAVTDED